MGKRMQTLINYVIDEGYVNFDKEQIGNLNNLNDRDTIILISNENEKPYVNLDRIVNGYDKYVKINPIEKMRRIYYGRFSVWKYI